jgi:uncharacterized protein YecE (DUF72 family)
MSSVEVNGSFYSLQRPESYLAWAAATPDDFVFAVKGGRYITHMKKLTGVQTPLANFFGSGVLALGPKLGPVLWQLPERFHRDDDRLAFALERLPPGRHCFEFRHESWFTEPVYKQLRAHGAALVIADHPRWPFQARVLTADWTLVRLHHGHRGRDGNYSRTEIDEWASRIADWRREAEVFVYFNNDWKGYAPANALSLMRRLRLSRDG